MPAINGRIKQAYVQIGQQGLPRSSFRSDAAGDWIYLHLKYSYQVSGCPCHTTLEIVEYYEDGFATGRRQKTITAEDGYIGGAQWFGIGQPPSQPWAPGRYWIYVYNEGRKVAAVEYTAQKSCPGFRRRPRQEKAPASTCAGTRT